MSDLLKWAMSYEAEAVVNASVDDVFTYLTNLGRHEEWVGGEIDWAGEGPVGIGSTFRGVVTAQYAGAYAAPEQKLQTFTVTQFLHKRRLAYACSRGWRLTRGVDL